MKQGISIIRDVATHNSRESSVFPFMQMAEAKHRFGALSSADVKLWLTGSNDEKYERNPVYLHSVILRRSEFFEVKMSGRWSSDKLSEVRVTTSHNFDDYLKCIELMYGERVHFSNVEECLAILSVASELLVNDCINKCMQYLEAVRWSAEQESQIRDVLSRLGLTLLPDLAARLNKEDDDHLIFMEGIISQMVFLIRDKNHQTTRNRETAKKYIVGILEGNTSRDVVEVCGRVLLQAFKSSIGSHDFSTVRSFVKLIEHCDGEILKTAFIAFCEDSKLTKYVQDTWRMLYNYEEDVFYTIIWFMKAIGDGKIIILRASRISFLTTWLPIMGELCSRKVKKPVELDKAVLNVIKSLPLVDKKRICVVWAKVYNENSIDIATPFTFSMDLQDDHHKSTSKQ